MPHLVAKYTNEQREAMASAYVDSGVRPGERVAEMAGRGELVLRGERLDAFETNGNTVRYEATRLRKRRSRAIAQGTNGVSPRDAVENYRQRLGVIIDRKIADLEKTAPKRLEPAQLQGMARVVKEFASLPGPDDPRPVAPGQKIPGTQENSGSRIRTGLGAEIVAAAKDGRVSTLGSTATEPPSPSTPGVDVPSNGADEGQRGERAGMDDEPGSWAIEQVASLST